MVIVKSSIIFMGSIFIGWSLHGIYVSRQEIKINALVIEASTALESAKRYMIHLEAARQVCATQNILLREELDRLPVNSLCKQF